MSAIYEKAVQPLVTKIYSSKTEEEMLQNFEEIKAILTSMLESEEEDAMDTIITTFYALADMVKVQAVSIRRMQFQIRELEKAIIK